MTGDECSHGLIPTEDIPTPQSAAPLMATLSRTAYVLRTMKVHEIMTAHARCVSPDNNIVEAAGLMRELNVGALPVCHGDEVAGIVTDRDLVVRGIADGRDPNQIMVRDVMTHGVAYVLAEQDVEEAVRVMEQKQIRRVPVLNRAKRLVGIISLGDVAISSNPAFSGTALRDVSESNNPSGRQRRLQAISHASGPNGSGPAMPSATATRSRRRVKKAARSRSKARRKPSARRASARKGKQAGRRTRT